MAFISAFDELYTRFSQKTTAIRFLTLKTAAKKHLLSEGAFLSVHNIDRNFLSLSLGYSPHKNTNLLYDSSLPANDLAHIAIGHTDFKNRLSVGFALGHRYFIGVIDEVLHNVGQ